MSRNEMRESLSVCCCCCCCLLVVMDASNGRFGSLGDFRGFLGVAFQILKEGFDGY